MTQSHILTSLDAKERSLLIGDFIQIMMGSSLHRKYDLDDFSHVMLPAINLNQFRIYHRNKQPVAFVTWAYLSKEAEHKFIVEDGNLAPDDWNSGPELWAIDFTAPFGDAKKVIIDLKNNIFPDKCAKALKVDKDGNVRTVIKLHGKDYYKNTI